MQIQIPKPKILSFGCTAKYHTIFPLKISPEIQWACPFGQIQIPNTNTNTKNLKCSVLVVQQSVIPFFHSTFCQKSNGHVHLTKYQSQIQIQIQIQNSCLSVYIHMSPGFEVCSTYCTRFNLIC